MIVRELSLELASGMTALTGETGAGKSILIDALGLVLGNKVDKGMIRSGRDQAEINAEFDLEDAPEAKQWLQENALTARMNASFAACWFATGVHGPLSTTVPCLPPCWSSWATGWSAFMASTSTS